MTLKYFDTNLSFMLRKIKDNNLDVYVSRRKKRYSHYL